jgi:hypothetical protein
MSINNNISEVNNNNTIDNNKTFNNLFKSVNAKNTKNGLSKNNFEFNHKNMRKTSGSTKNINDKKIILIKILQKYLKK